MGLRNLSFPEVMVETAGGAFAVRGLTPDMVLGLYHRHRGQLAALFDGLVQGDQLNTSDVATIAASLLQTAPDIMAELIALASGSKPTDEENWEPEIAIARNLPLPVQVDALTKIGEQTFSSSMPPGKFLAVVVQMAGATTAVIQNR